MAEMSSRPFDRPASRKQLDYIRGLRKKVFDLLGSQTPEKFLQSNLDDKLDIIMASLLIRDMRSTLEEGTPPVRPAPKSQGAGYEESGAELERDHPLDGRTYMRVWQKYPRAASARWAWMCFHPDHRRPVDAPKGREHPDAIIAAVAHWKKFHGSKE